MEGAKMKARTRRLTITLLTFALIMMPAISGISVYAQGTDSLTDAQKNSSYGFFVWLSENADTAAEKADAEIAVQILTDSISDSSKVFNDGSISGGSGTITYQDLLNASNIGADNDATSLENLRQAINFASLGNTYRAKESLAPLKYPAGLWRWQKLMPTIRAL